MYGNQLQETLEATHIQIKKLWEYLTTYCYLPRLANLSVLEETIRAGVASDEAFAIASGYSGDRFTELRYNTSISTVYTSDCLVKVLVALKQLNAEKDNGGNGGGSGGEGGGGSTGGSSGGSDGGDNGGGSGGTDTTQNNDTRFTMSVKLDNTRVIRDLQNPSC